MTNSQISLLLPCLSVYEGWEVISKYRRLAQEDRQDECREMLFKYPELKNIQKLHEVNPAIH